MDPPNHVVYGEWRKIKVLGSGGFGQVSLWENINTHEKIAIKMCKQQLQERSLSRWQQEVDIMKNLNHQSIVSFRKVPKFIQDRYVTNHVALGMEFCELGDLRKMLSHPKNCCGLEEYQVRDLLLNIGSAIHFLHSKNIVHRDLKPENIVMKSIGPINKIQYKIIDLGYAKDLNEHSCGTSFVGTLHYLAPEFFSDQQLRYTATVDFWSFGLVAFECITGRRPFFPHLEVMQYMPFLKDKKKDDAVCTVDDDSTGSKVQFLSRIPQPYALNSILVEKLGYWLRDMLMYDPKRRGGGGRSGDGWYNSLQTVLDQKHILVYNTHTSSIITVVAESNMGMRKFQEEIGRQTRITADNQILLFKDGVKPDITKRAADQCWKPPSQENWMVYLYSERDDYPTPDTSLPKDVANLVVMAEPRAQLNSKKLRRILCLAINFVSTQCRTCQQSMSALYAIAKSVQRHHSYFSTCIKDLTRLAYTFSGTLEHYANCLEKDIQCYNDYDNVLSFEDDNLINQWYVDREEIKSFHAALAQVNDSVLASMNAFVAVNATTKKSFDFIESTTKLLLDKISTSYKKYDEIKMKIRQLTDYERPVRQEPRPDSKNVVATMKDLILNFINPLIDELNKLSTDAREQTRNLLGILNNLSRHVAECVDAKQSLNNDIATLQQKQIQRQETLWGFVLWFKSKADELNNYFIEAMSSTTGYGDNGDPSTTVSVELTSAMDQNRYKLESLVDDLVQDFSLTQDMDWGYLHTIPGGGAVGNGDTQQNPSASFQTGPVPSSSNNLPPTENEVASKLSSITLRANGGDGHPPNPSNSTPAPDGASAN